MGIYYTFQLSDITITDKRRQIMYVQIDENRKQTTTYSGYSGKNIEGAIKVDCGSPDKWHILKTDYESFSGEDQWEMNLEGIKLLKIRGIKAEKAKQVYGNAYVDTGDTDEAKFELTETNRQILMSKAQDMSLFSVDVDAIFTGVEMPKIKLADETWITVPPEKCLPWAKQVSLLTQMAFNKEYESQEAISEFKAEVEAETKTLQEFIDYDFIADYNTALKAAIQDHDKFAYPEQFYNEDA